MILQRTILSSTVILGGESELMDKQSVANTLMKVRNLVHPGQSSVNQDFHFSESFWLKKIFTFQYTLGGIFSFLWHIIEDLHNRCLARYCLNITSTTHNHNTISF